MIQCAIDLGDDGSTGGEANEVSKEVRITVHSGQVLKNNETWWKFFSIQSLPTVHDKEDNSDPCKNSMI